MIRTPDPSYEGIPLAALLWIGGEFIGQGERRLRRQRRPSSFESRTGRKTQGFAIKGPAHGEPPDIEKLFHSAIRQREMYHRLGFLGD